MDIISYLLGKQSSGGGGGGGELDWSAIGYNSTPEAIVDGYNYAKQIQEEWTPTGSFSTNAKILICPMVDTSAKIDFSHFF